MTPAATTCLVKQAAQDAGFDLVGITRAEAPPNSAYYRAWLSAGHAGSMDYLHRNAEVRENPALLLAGARSVICLGVSYKRGTEARRDVGTEGKAVSGSGALGQVAMYTRGDDYHRVLKGMMGDLVEQLASELDAPFEWRAFVDTGPLLERQLATAAGLGWVGKNTLVLNERLGSFFFLGELVTTLELVSDAPATDHCGSCTRCLDACPTDALIAPYKMDARRCISYLTIEHRDEIDEALARQVGDWVYGCDICQDVCPFNTKAPETTNTALAANRIPARLPLLPLLTLRAGEYRRLTKRTAASRASSKMWRRNARIALTNAPAQTKSEMQALSTVCKRDDDPDGAA